MNLTNPAKDASDLFVGLRTIKTFYGSNLPLKYGHQGLRLDTPTSKGKAQSELDLPGSSGGPCKSPDGEVIASGDTAENRRVRAASRSAEIRMVE